MIIFIYYRKQYIHTALEKHSQKKYKKILAIMNNLVYTCYCCGIDSEEAWGCLVIDKGFPWSECWVRKLATSHCTRI